MEVKPGRIVYAGLSAFSLEQNEVVPVYQLRFAHVAQDGFDIVAGAAEDSSGFRGAVIDESARNFLSRGIEATHHLAALEVAIDMGDAYR